MGDRALSGEENGGGVPEMRSAVNWALLGLLIERSGYGYDLSQRLERAYGQELGLSSRSRVYKALDALEHRGLIERVPEPSAPGPGGQARLRYRATERGVCEYQDWLISQVAHVHQRYELFGQLLAVLEPQAALVVLDRYEQNLLDTRGRARRRRADPTLGTSPLARRLIEEMTRLETGTALEWTAYLRRELQAAIAEQTPAPRPRP